ncbi:hypothetical protein NEUTE1DRAFT_141250 [Neurospora tetrasperma FGSC 2508]|uniref:Uncharacterized protein n=1 Tax=Neurospora tetrasperma (strain FGSC 2508 / ATCC MYA-4615 / P0657) TaxID=510951 RepID=F8MXW9_NEUT8|nr:uncharacterized protein NEUTE1DRAFT_141250 [Neurospora tetrasperma FGSC 2508]EGO53854.1 hypothetical protein NEUTE1DRAFT_141250 [Neurospora tetrasperma FGSC 2508]EGZ76190.1 hypothetical protein NEUTE2DRAFT_161134 [Neurospora tetrasperma FGSC 2509]
MPNILENRMALQFRIFSLIRSGADVLGGQFICHHQHGHVLIRFSRIDQPTLSYHIEHPPPHETGSLEIMFTEELGHLLGGNVDHGLGCRCSRGTYRGSVAGAEFGRSGQRQLRKPCQP